VKEVIEEPQRRVTVGLMWHSLGSGNLGVGALTESNIAIIRGVAERLGLVVCFVVLGTSDTTLPDLTAELAEAGHELEVTRIRVFRQQFRAILKRCDLVIDIGEGDSFADIYGLKRFLFYWLSKNIVCLLGKPLILAPQTIGPFDGTVARVLARQVMARCKRVFARDYLSTEYLSRLGVTENADEAIDVAFKLPYSRPASSKNGKVRVGINVSGLLFNGGYTGNNQFGLSIDYAETIRAIVRHFFLLPEVEVHLISHVIEPNMPIEDDVVAAKKLANEFLGVIVSPAFTRPSQAKSYIAGMDFFIGARMHACIAAFSAGIPVIPMAYSRKFNGLFGTLGYVEIADCKKDSNKEVIEKIISGFENRERLQTLVLAALLDVERRLGRYDHAMADVLGRLVGNVSATENCLQTAENKR
jgi:colanic acid/amylovoran biosynthesis protein